MKAQKQNRIMKQAPRLMASLVMAIYGGASSSVLAAPYTGTPITVPATIQAKNFDTGGQGVGYNDLSSGNAGGLYRTSEGVDIIASTDTTSGGHVVNNFQTGEWMAYTINVPAAGTYDISVLASNNLTSGSPAFALQLNGATVASRIPVASTGNWETFSWVTARGIALPAGQHVLRLVSQEQYINVSAIRVQAAATSAPVTAPVTGGTPYSGTPVALPGSFEAENFDKGGQNVGYNDLTSGNSGGLYRTSEGVDIIASTDSAGGGHVVNNFQTGEWLAYTVNIPTAGKYDIGVRAAHNYSGTPAFHVQLDGARVTGSIAVPRTGTWDTFAWVDARGVDLPAGQHVLKLVADAEYFNVNSLRVQPSATTTAPTPPSSSGTPYTGTPITVPVAFEAENFNKGGEGAGYHDLTSTNTGGLYRTAEGVDIIASSDSAGGGHVVNNFQAGEWLAYTINVPTTGNYDLAIRAASNHSTTGAFHFEVNNVDVTGRINVANTGAWTNFAWVGKTNVPLTAGTHVLKLVADAPYFDVNSISVLRTGTTPAPAPEPAPAPVTSSGSNIPTTGVNWSCDFEGGSMCGFSEQGKTKRSSFVSQARSAVSGIRLHTEPGDSNVNGSGTWERNDLSFGKSSTYCNPGQEEWWGHSVMFPSDYVFPPSASGIVFDFHHSGSTGQANFEIQTVAGIGIRLRGHGGSTVSGGRFDAVVPDPYGAVANVTKNRWYDFNYHVKWSSGSDGFLTAWLNGKRVMNYRGPTLYSGQTCYLKLANYHAPFGQASSVIHDRVVRGTSAAAVSLHTLE